MAAAARASAGFSQAVRSAESPLVTTREEPSPPRTPAAVASSLAVRSPFFSGWKAKAPPSAHFRLRPSSASPGVLSFLEATASAFVPVAARAPITSEVELVSVSPPGMYPQPPSSFCADFSQSTALPTTLSWPPRAASACTAVAVWLVSTGVLASQSADGSARNGANEPSAHCWPVSQSTAFAAGSTPAVCCASSARDWR